MQAPGSSLTAWLAGEFDPDKTLRILRNNMNIFRIRGCDEAPSDECATIGSSDTSSRQRAEIPAKEKDSLYAACGA
jgi:hypothetical protein